MIREVYVSIDGDDVGRLLTQKIYENGDDSIVTNFSQSITLYFENIAKSLEQENGQVLFCTGDSIFFKFPRENLLHSFLACHEPQGFNISIGIGYTRKEAHWALNVAKSLGKDRIIHFNQVRQDFFGNAHSLLECD
ncbi:MAG: mCpol domain-containing protein [Cyanobacteria bacterium P01_G01_bin.54]